jgi:hypothetical protein
MYILMSTDMVKNIFNDNPLKHFKAFDRVWIRGLIYELEKYGVRGDILEWLKSYLTDRK